MIDVDEGLWELYVTDCRMKELTPSIKDYLVWKQEEGYDEEPLDYTTHDDHIERDLVGGPEELMEQAEALRDAQREDGIV